MVFSLAISALPGPAPGTAGFGALRCAVLDAWVRAESVQIPASTQGELTQWLDGIATGCGGPAQGLDPVGVPADWADTLRWSGVPFASPGTGALRWGRDFVLAEVDAPEQRDGRLLLPPVQVLARLTSLSLKPARTFVGQRLGVRLQMAPAVHLYLWPARAVVVSQAALALAGFLVGPGPGQRSSLALEPGSAQTVALAGSP